MNRGDAHHIGRRFESCQDRHKRKVFMLTDQQFIIILLLVAVALLLIHPPCQ